MPWWSFRRAAMASAIHNTVKARVRGRVACACPRGQPLKSWQIIETRTTNGTAERPIRTSWFRSARLSLGEIHARYASAGPNARDARRKGATNIDSPNASSADRAVRPVSQAAKRANGGKRKTSHQ